MGRERPVQPSSSTPILMIDQISKWFGGVQAVNDCSLSIERGSITGLIGPNGAGKTTLFNMIAGAFPPTSGTMQFEGQDITRLPAHQRFHQGVVRTFQIPHDFSRMTCLENLMLVPANQRGEGLLSSWFTWSSVRSQESELKRRAEEVLEFIGMTHLRDQRAGNVSGGQKKLLELGRTMMAEPTLVLLDEPGAGVNRTLLGRIVELIRKLNQDFGHTFCIIEHDMGFIAELCDPVICMAEGAILTSGSMNQVRNDPRVLEAYLGRSGTDALEGRH